MSAPRSPQELEFAALVRARRLRPPRHGFLDASLRRLGAYFTAALLREEVARRSGALQRLDPRARLAGLLLVIVSVSLARSLPALAALAALALSGVAAGRIRPGEILGAGLAVAAGFSLLMALPATLNLTTGGEPVVPLLRFSHAWSFGPYTIPAVVGISAEGLRTAATFLLRTVTSVTAVLCVALTTRWTDLLGALRILRVPVLVLQIAGMTLRYLHLLLRQSEEVHLARKSRTVARHPLRADQRWVGARLAAAWGRSLHLMTEVADAMTARGFSGEIRPADTPPLRTRDWIALALIAAGCAAAHIV